MYSYGAWVNDLMNMISPGLSQKTVHMSPVESIKTRHSPCTPGKVSIEQSKMGVTAPQSLGLGGGSALTLEAVSARTRLRAMIPQIRFTAFLLVTDESVVDVHRVSAVEHFFTDSAGNVSGIRTHGTALLVAWYRAKYCGTRTNRSGLGA